MDIKSLFDKFRKKPESDDLMDSDPMDVGNEQPSKFNSLFNIFRKKRTDDIEQRHGEGIPLAAENTGDSSKSHLTTNIALFCVLVVITGTGAYIIRSNNKDKPVSTFQSAKKTTVKNTDTAPTPGEVKVAYGNVMINPFVDLGEMKNKVKQEEAKARKATIPPPIRSAESDEASSFLPAIPSFTPPSQPANAAHKVQKVGSIPAPLGGRPSEETPAQSGPVEVQGILMGNDGSSMAILSDGSVVETGDTYKDGRIAYIGGDGIKFDDGSSMQFKE